MLGVFLIAHAPLASALKAVAEHAFPDCASKLAVLDVQPDMVADDVVVAAQALMTAAGHVEWLVLADTQGATPCNAAMQLLDPAGHVRLVTGLNVPMLWRTLCYGDQPLDALAALAAEGGETGITIADVPVNPSESK